jgi:hypothetical protein
LRRLAAPEPGGHCSPAILIPLFVIVTLVMFR